MSLMTLGALCGCQAILGIKDLSGTDGEGGDATTGSGGTSSSSGTMADANASASQDDARSDAEPACSPACGFRTTGGIRSSAPTPNVGAAIYIVSGGFEQGRTTCGDAGFCVTGGIVP